MFGSLALTLETVSGYCLLSSPPPVGLSDREHVGSVTQGWDTGNTRGKWLGLGGRMRHLLKELILDVSPGVCGQGIGLQEGKLELWVWKGMA